MVRMSGTVLLGCAVFVAYAAMYCRQPNPRQLLFTRAEITRMHIKLANPRGFCAGVDRAIEIVNRA